MVEEAGSVATAATRTAEATSARSLKHVAVREYVRSLVVDMEAGSPAPSERELVHRFGVARMTVRQAMDALVTEGLLDRMPGRGTFVARPRREVGRLSSFTEEMARRGLSAGSETLAARQEQAGPGVAKALGITAGDAVVHWRRLRCADGEPICVEDAYLNEVLLPGFLHVALPASLYDGLASRGLRPTWAEDSVATDQAVAPDAGLLRVPVGTPVLRVTRRALAGDRPVHVSRSTFRGDRYALRVQVGDA